MRRRAVELRYAGFRSSNARVATRASGWNLGAISLRHKEKGAQSVFYPAIAATRRDVRVLPRRHTSAGRPGTYSPDI